MDRQSPSAAGGRGHPGSFRSHRFRVAGWDINAVLAGSGPPIIFLHGLGGSWRWWTPILADFCDEFSVCAVDLPGAGSSSPLQAEPNPDVYGPFVAELINEVGRGPAVVVGHSLGGYVAVQAALLRAAGMRAVVLVAPAGFGPIHHPLFRLLGLAGVGDLLMWPKPIGVWLALATLVHNPRSITPEMRAWTKDALASSANRQQFLRQVRWGLRLSSSSDPFVLRNVDPPEIPRLLIWGQHDRLFPVYQARRAADLLECEPPHIFANSGHIPQLEEQAKFEALLRRFALEWSSPVPAP